MTQEKELEKYQNLFSELKDGIRSLKIRLLIKGESDWIDVNIPFDCLPKQLWEGGMGIYDCFGVDSTKRDKNNVIYLVENGFSEHNYAQGEAYSPAGEG